MMGAVNGNLITANEHPPEVNGNRHTYGSYSFHRCPSGGWGIFKGSGKIATVEQVGDEGRYIAFDMVKALNARERFLSTKDFNKIENGR